MRTFQIQEHGSRKELQLSATLKNTFLKVFGRKHFTGTGKEFGTSGSTLHPAVM